MMLSTTSWQPVQPSDAVMAGYHYLFLINPAAGQPKRPDLEEKLAAAVTCAGSPHTCEIRRTDRAGHGAELAAAFAKRHGAQAIVVACGGDGTAHEIAQALLGTDAALAILPLGTGNDFARAFLSSLDVDQLLSRLTMPQIRPIDVLEVNGRMCLNITSFGFDTRVQSLMMAINRRLRWLGRLSYPLAIVIGLLGHRTFSFSCALDGGPRENVHYILAALCNGRFYGGGFNPAPGASVEDGKIEWVQVDPLSLPRILGLIPKYKQGRHLGDPAVHSRTISEGHVWAMPGQVLLGNVDGELFETTEITFKVWPAAIRFAFF
ncbi:MAG: diacylglycerol kinase family lipid kinase [Clostridia bacterium]|nr:diacylglycerol kinase family lipid kinase [Clostridia bacterium]